MDIIQKRLEIIDNKLATNPEYIHKQIICKSPLVFVAAGLIAGIALQNYFPLPISVWLIILLVSSLLAVITFFKNKSASSKYIIAYLALICFTCLGAVRLKSLHKAKPGDISSLIGNEQSLATIRGVITTDPYTNKNDNWKFARFKFSDPAASFYLKTTAAKTTSGWANLSGTIRVQVHEPVIDLKTGDYIQLYCWLERFNPAANPGQFDIKQYLNRKNIHISASVKTREGIELLKNNPRHCLTKIKTFLRQKASQFLLSNLSPQDTAKALLEALLLGYRKNIDSKTYLAFQKTGLLHFISLSGMHFGILIAIIWSLCKTAGLLKRPRSIICIITAIIFLLIIPPRAPALRAAVITIIFCLSFLFRRTPNPFNSLSLAAIILLLFKPAQLFEAGFQLSFATVLGILLFNKRIHFFLYDKSNYLMSFESPQDKNLLFSIAAKIYTQFLKLFSVGFAAWLGGCGILLYHFYSINPLASLWTVLAFPLVAAILTLGFLKIILSILLPTLGSLLALIVSSLSNLLITIVKIMTAIDISEILIGHISIVLIVIYYITIIFIAFFHLRRPIIKTAISAALILTLFMSLSFIKFKRAYRSSLTLTCLDVSHGQALLIQMPGTANLLFDAGSLFKADPAKNVILPFLRYSGISKIDAIIISHGDIDHINAIPEIIENCKVSSLFANEPFFESAETWSAEKYLKDSLNINIENINNSPLPENPARLKILWPDTKAENYPRLSENDKSSVFLLEFAERKILLCSDIEKSAQNQLLQIHPRLKADIVIVPHHGSSNTLDLNFLKKLSPSALICSCSRTQYEKQPLRSITCKSFYTVRDGAITISIQPNGKIEQSCFLK